MVQERVLDFKETEERICLSSTVHIPVFKCKQESYRLFKQEFLKDPVNIIYGEAPNFKVSSYTGTIPSYGWLFSTMMAIADNYIKDMYYLLARDGNSENLKVTAIYFKKPIKTDIWLRVNTAPMHFTQYDGLRIKDPAELVVRPEDLDEFIKTFENSKSLDFAISPNYKKIEAQKIRIAFSVHSKATDDLVKYSIELLHENSNIQIVAIRRNGKLQKR